ncbi:hypothetical protein, partial [Sphingomonas sp.]|uniref:hypothetical protein n=1 Tax=Sphingomonas sp. TaxID=28214 RepID=UPI0033417612
FDPPRLHHFFKYAEWRRYGFAQFVMDVAGSSPYMRHRTMNWLLVLSALFSTLTGVSVGARPIEATIQQSALAASVRRQAIVAVRPARGHVHLLGAFGLGERFACASHVAGMTLASPRLYLDRLRA